MKHHWLYKDEDKTTWKYSGCRWKKCHETGEYYLYWRLNKNFKFKDIDKRVAEIA